MPKRRPENSLICLTDEATLFAGKKEELEKLKDEFSRRHVVCLPGFLDKTLMTYIQQRMGKGRSKFYNKRHKGLALEMCMRENAAVRLLHFVMNDRRLFELVGKITGMGQIGCFHGRIYCMKSGLGHHHKWHTDFSHDRILGVSVNLSTETFQGGELQIRNGKSHKILTQVHNSGLGDVIIFRLDKELEHRVAVVKGDIDKLAFAGWFQTKPDYWAAVKRRFLQKQKRDRSRQLAAAPA